MMKYLFFIFHLSLLGITSCNNNVIDSPTPPNEEEPTEIVPEYELVWEKALQLDTSSSISLFPLSYSNGKLIYAQDILNQIPRRSEIVAIDIETGNRLWTYNGNYGNSTFYDGYIENDQLYINGGINNELIVKLNLTEGEESWRLTNDESKSRLYSPFYFNEEFLISRIVYSNTLVENNKIIKINKLDGAFDTIYQIGREDDYNLGISSFVAYVDESGDEILVFSYVKFISVPFETHAYLVSYNLSKDKVMWRVDDFDPYGAVTGKCQPIIEGNRIYIKTNRSMHCFDLITGEHLWHTDYPFTNFTWSNYLLAEELIIMVSDEGHLIGMDKHTGNQVYFHDYSAFVENLTYHDGRLYYASEHLFIVDAATGVLKHKLKDKNYKKIGAYFTNTVVINAEENLMYVIDDYYIQAIKIPD